jgi:GNAT superfamily N-acetyltransferase
MKIQIEPVELDAISKLRDLYRQELNCQIVHDCAHFREKCFQSHLITVNGQVVGYGSTWVGPYWMNKNSLFEFYVTPPYRPLLFSLFEELLKAVRPSRIYTQTNDPFLSVVFPDYIEKPVVGHILFKDVATTHHVLDGVVFRRAMPEDKEHIFPHKVEPVGDWLLETEGKIAATGGMGFHYNRPYGDIYMEVEESFRKRGFGRFLVQELKRVCYEGGSVPAARCRPTNLGSRRTLEGAGFAPCARLVYGDVAGSGV